MFNEGCVYLSSVLKVVTNYFGNRKGSKGFKFFLGGGLEGGGGGFVFPLYSQYILIRFAICFLKYSQNIYFLIPSCFTMVQLPCMHFNYLYLDVNHLAHFFIIYICMLWLVGV
jgi:hypothetical protein